MKLKIKKSYKIMGKSIKVKFVNTNAFAGQWDPMTNTIYLSIHQTQLQMEETFWHEMGHCMQHFSGVNQAVSIELMEIMAEMNSRIISSVIRDS